MAGAYTVLAMTREEALEILFSGQNVFLTGAAGTGKTHVLNEYIGYLKENYIHTAVTASTGIAATHMGGRTIHSWSGIAKRKRLSEKELQKLFFNDYTRERITGARVLIIDEISMLEARVFSLIDTVCKSVRGNARPFGGLQLVVSGDFFQLPPVPDKREPPPEFAFHSPSWAAAQFRVCYLEKQYRQEDPIFLNVLNNIRDSKVTRETVAALKSRLNQPIKSVNLQRATELHCLNRDVDRTNQREFERLTTDPHRFFMRTWGEPELVKMLREDCLAPEELILKKGALVMFVRNNPGEGYVNGTLGTVVGFEEETDYPIVERSQGGSVVAREARWTVEEDDEVLAWVDQIPLRLAWAITVHKSQGMTLDAAQVNIGRAFADGMGYVALSRVRRFEDMNLMGINPKALMVSPEITAFDAMLRAESSSNQKELQENKKLYASLQSDFLLR